MAAIPVKAIVYPQTAGPTFAAASAGGDTVVPGDRTRLIVKNGGGSPVTVTIPVFPATLATGMAQPALVVTVPASGESWIGPLNAASHANPANGLAAISYSGVTSVTVAAISD